jgi:hypothetical protein
LTAVNLVPELASVLSRAKSYQRRSISSNLLTATILGIFVGLVIIAMVVVYLAPSSSPQAVFQGITLSGLTLYSGPGSTVSYTQGCDIYEAQLVVYATNNSTTTILLSNETFYGSNISHNGTGLVPVSGGCLPIAQSPANVSSGVDDYTISTYPSVAIPLGTSCYVELQFSNGQNFTQLVVAQAE